MATIIRFRPRPDAKLVGLRICQGPHPDHRQPYNRSEALAFMHWVPEHWRFDPIDLQYAYEPKKALQIVLKTRHAVRKVLRRQAELERTGSLLYDRSYHINLKRIEQRETDLAWRLFDLWERQKPKPRTAADEINGIRDDLAEIMSGEVA